MNKPVKKYKYFLFLIPVLPLLMPSAVLADIQLPQSLLDYPVRLYNFDNQKPVVSEQSVEPGVNVEKGKSKTKAVLLSLLVPGAGQWYLGEKGRGEVFIGVEAVAWAGFAAFRTTGSWKKDDYIKFAERHAGIDPTDKDDEFYKNLSFYDSRDQYNTAGRIINPTGPWYPATSEYYWLWDSETSRILFKNLRDGSKSDFKKATFMIVAALLNRVVAGIDTFRIARKLPSLSSDYSSEQTRKEKIKVGFKANPFGSNPEIKLTLSRRF